MTMPIKINKFIGSVELTFEVAELIDIVVAMGTGPLRLLVKEATEELGRRPVVAVTLTDVEAYHRALAIDPKSSAKINICKAVRQRTGCSLGDALEAYNRFSGSAELRIAGMSNDVW
jgi:ribosomal protein L7/L12